MGHGPWALGHGPWAMGHGPWAMGHGPWANRAAATTLRHTPGWSDGRPAWLARAGPEPDQVTPDPKYVMFAVFWHEWASDRRCEVSKGPR